MGLRDVLGLGKSATVDPGGEHPVEFMPGVFSDYRDMSAEALFREQPHLRTVTTFIARMVATVSLHLFERADDGGRLRVRDGWVATVLERPNPRQTMFDLLHDSVMDLCLYDEFIWHVSSDDSRPDRFHINRIAPSEVVNSRWSDPWTLKAIAIADHQRGGVIWLPAEQIIRLHGYSPFSRRRGLSPIDALKDILREQLEAAAYRGQLWQNGPRLGGIITRPAGVHWDDKARRRFKQSWRAQYSGRGSGAGGVPVLEDGMTFQAFHLNARDEQLVEMTKLSLQTVAQVYHVNPTMVGLLDNANYSNVREFRQSLYGDSLGPLMKRIESMINAFLLPMLEAQQGFADRDPVGDGSRYYAEFNVEERLRGRFEEQAAVTSTAVGAPWMTRNEARAMNNLPAVEGGDALVLPLNTAADPGGEDAPETDPATADEGAADAEEEAP